MQRGLRIEAGFHHWDVGTCHEFLSRDCRAFNRADDWLWYSWLDLEGRLAHALTSLGLDLRQAKAGTKAWCVLVFAPLAFVRDKLYDGKTIENVLATIVSGPPTDRILSPFHFLLSFVT